MCSLASGATGYSHLLKKHFHTVSLSISLILTAWFINMDLNFMDTLS
ncbi:PRMT3 isoform 6 [Pan troglodytes]|uniref:Protein arginine methyltransferase 3 n=2 Tax=Homininae TaxID=207598 RepID=E9PLF6_HUMAN|nr:PRMT3 isoform 1 [Pan troglodytes]PNI78960.1 PRMT3 isoform 6 [Pan troglodytes]